MTKNKTAETVASVADFLNKIIDGERRDNAFKLLEIMQQESGFEPKIWGTAIVGFGSYHYKYESGRDGDAPRTGFSPRAKEFAIYLSPDFKDKSILLQKFGKHRAGVGCIYVKKVMDINTDVLRQMIRNSITQVAETYG